LNWLNTYRMLPHARRRLLPRTVLLVAAVRVGLWILPFDRLRRFMHALPPRPAALAGSTPRDLAWAVAAASRRIPAASCLTQSLALQKLLDAAGHASRLEIGVAKSAERGFQAHAWVECGGQTLLSSPLEASTYQRLLTLENDPARN
jgi:hypothetical protein